MSAVIKTPEEIEKMRVAGRLAAEVLEMIEPHVKPGVTTEELNTICHNYIVDVQGAVPAPLNYHGFPKSICTSVKWSKQLGNYFNSTSVIPAPPESG